MGWLIDELWAEGHEGYAEGLLPDGESSGTYSGGWVVRRGGIEHVVPYGAETGWRAVCTCGWVGPVIERAVTLPGTSGGHYPEDAYLSDGTSVDDALAQAWETTHMTPAGSMAEIRAAAAEANRARARLDAAVRSARASSRPPSWAEIGAAVGISRQSAHERWGG